MGSTRVPHSPSQSAIQTPNRPLLITPKILGPRRGFSRTKHTLPAKKLPGQIPLCVTSLEPSDFFEKAKPPRSALSSRNLGSIGSNPIQLCSFSSACWKWVCFQQTFPVSSNCSLNVPWLCSLQNLHAFWKHYFPCSPLTMRLFSFHIQFHTWLLTH